MSGCHATICDNGPTHDDQYAAGPFSRSQTQAAGSERELADLPPHWLGDLLLHEGLQALPDVLVVIQRERFGLLKGASCGECSRPGNCRKAAEATTRTASPPSQESSRATACAQRASPGSTGQRTPRNQSANPTLSRLARPQGRRLPNPLGPELQHLLASRQLLSTLASCRC